MISPLKLVFGLALAAKTFAAPVDAPRAEFGRVIQGFNTVGQVLTETATIINDFPETGGQLTDISAYVDLVISNEQDVVISLKDFAIANGPFNSAEFKYMTEGVDYVVPGFETVLSNLSKKKATLEAAIGSKKILDIQISDLLTVLKTFTDDFLTTLISGASAESKQHFVDSKNKVDADFASTLTTFSS